MDDAQGTPPESERDAPVATGPGAPPTGSEPGVPTPPEPRREQPLTGSAPPWVGSPHQDEIKPKKEKQGSFLKELPILIIIAFGLALLIKTFLVQAFYIPSESMVPTLKVGDRVLVNKLTYRFHPPGRGDIIVFEDPNAPPTDRGIVSGFVHWVTDGLGLTTSPDKDLIKRVIGLPGDSVEIRRGNVFVNGSRLGPEPYLSPIADVSCCPGQSWTVPPGKLFVMGDNRTNSSDSRTSLGFIPIDKVVGRAFVIIWPPSRIHWLSTPKYS